MAVANLVAQTMRNSGSWPVMEMSLNFLFLPYYNCLENLTEFLQCFLLIPTQIGKNISKSKWESFFPNGFGVKITKTI